MSRTDMESKPLLILVALLAALAMSAGLMRGPTDEQVLAEAVRDLASGEGTVLHPAAAKLSPFTDATEATELDEKAPVKFATCALHSTRNPGCGGGNPGPLGPAWRTQVFTRRC